MTGSREVMLSAAPDMDGRVRARAQLLERALREGASIGEALATAKAAWDWVVGEERAAPATPAAVAAPAAQPFPQAWLAEAKAEAKLTPSEDLRPPAAQQPVDPPAPDLAEEPAADQTEQLPQAEAEEPTEETATESPPEGASGQEAVPAVSSAAPAPGARPAPPWEPKQATAAASSAAELSGVYQPWTPALDAEVDRRRAKGDPWREIADALGKTVPACQVRYSNRQRKSAARKDALPNAGTEQSPAPSEPEPARAVPALASRQRATPPVLPPRVEYVVEPKPFVPVWKPQVKRPAPTAAAPTKPKLKPGERYCMTCQTPFPSEGSHNRLCPRHRHVGAGLPDQYV